MNDVQRYDAVTAERENAKLDAIRRLTPVVGPFPEPATPFPHPWACSVVAGAAQGQWRATLLAGWVNDVEAPVAYLTQGDARGWVMPADYPSSRIANGVAMRSWREKVDPPYLLLNQSSDFSAVPDGARPAFYQTADAWTKDLLVASVYLSARPWNLFSGRILPAQYRTWAGKLPTLPTYPYGIFELARIYLLVGDQPGDVTPGVEQVEYWDLQCAPVDPVTVIPDYLT